MSKLDFSFREIQIEFPNTLAYKKIIFVNKYLINKESNLFFIGYN